MTPPRIDLSAVAPVMVVSVGAMTVLLGDVWLSRRASFLGRRVTGSWVATALAVVASGALLMALWAALSGLLADIAPVFNAAHPMLRLDRFANLATALVALGSLLAVWLSIDYLGEAGIHQGEYYALLLLATAGMMLMVAAVDLMMVFLGLEIMSIPIYVLAGFDRRRLRSNESSLKYFLTGAFASALMLYGIALLYGATGHLDLAGIGAAFPDESPLARIGLGLLLAGFAFKIAAVPFHQWVPDVYEGAPTSVTAFMSVTVKAAAFLTLMRVLGTGFGGSDENLSVILWGLAALSMLVGNVTAVVQDNVKRMLAYSSIGHAGYLLIGLVAGGPEGYAAVLFYLFAYLFMNLGAFGVLVVLAHRGRECERFDDFAGLAHSRPGLAAAMTLFMLSLAGIPGTVGFIAKFTIFSAAVQAGAVWLALIGVLTSVISVYFYLRLPVMMYMREGAGVRPAVAPKTAVMTALALCAVAVLALGLVPDWGPGLLASKGALTWARESAAALF